MVTEESNVDDQRAAVGQQLHAAIEGIGLIQHQRAAARLDNARRIKGGSGDVLNDATHDKVIRRCARRINGEVSAGEFHDRGDRRRIGEVVIDRVNAEAVGGIDAGNDQGRRRRRSRG